MQVGDVVRYRHTGTVGKIVDISEEEKVTWMHLDTTNLLYDSTTLDPASEEDYRGAAEREKGVRDSLEDIERLREEAEQMAEKISRITPSGAG
ncbi:DUF2098 domain-containing protein [Methanomassiliicoccus luminyensis]|jgi:hypothetical protein|uniref:DUF2098 domain-containing protein n=1 Tax=Methanomassiliicoccus luminyensis TaxID=1080712 RepID=UPI0003769830|nr:DUF2098 family protein [Methanomassiliicoccus luminyensis]